MNSNMKGRLGMVSLRPPPPSHDKFNRFRGFNLEPVRFGEDRVSADRSRLSPRLFVQGVELDDPGHPVRGP